MLEQIITGGWQALGEQRQASISLRRILDPQALYLCLATMPK